ncbi:hypothetical protein B0H12DRAFT_1161609 [Mycena haematopus]|nr:hypothetical protein B0H12DRAFT_1161609 [Mycena haematopus]
MYSCIIALFCDFAISARPRPASAAAHHRGAPCGGGGSVVQTAKYWRPRVAHIHLAKMTGVAGGAIQVVDVFENAFYIDTIYRAYRRYPGVKCEQCYGGSHDVRA